MSIVLKMFRCAWCCSWMSHLSQIMFYIIFAWNYTGFISNDYFMKTIPVLKPQNYVHKLQKILLRSKHASSSKGPCAFMEICYLQQRNFVAKFYLLISYSKQEQRFIFFWCKFILKTGDHVWQYETLWWCATIVDSP